MNDHVSIRLPKLHRSLEPWMGLFLILLALFGDAIVEWLV